MFQERFNEMLNTHVGEKASKFIMCDCSEQTSQQMNFDIFSPANVNNYFITLDLMFRTKSLKNLSSNNAELTHLKYTFKNTCKTIYFVEQRNFK